MRLNSLRFTLPCLLFIAAYAVPSAGADTFTFRANRISSTRALGSELTILAGDAEIHADNMLLRAKRIEISGDNNQFIYAIGEVWGMETGRNIVFRADRIRYDRNLRIARLEGNASLEGGENELVAKGNFIEFDEGREVTVIRIWESSGIVMGTYVHEDYDEAPGDMDLASYADDTIAIPEPEGGTI